MELTQLKQFKVVAETENIVDAGSLLKISQPALTKSIKNLEHELNITLFDRTNHKLVLNEHGKLVLRYINEILSDVDDMLTDLKYGSPEPDTIRLCSSINSILSFTTPKLTMDFPDLHFYCQFRKVHKFKSYIEQKVFDLAISTEKISTRSIESQIFLKDWVVISVPETSPLYEKELLELADLNGATFVNSANVAANPLPRLFETMLETRDIQVSYLHMPDIISLKKMLNETDFLSYSSSIGSLSMDFGENRRFIPIDANESLVLNYYISYLKKNRKQASIFVKWFKQQFNQYTLTY